jgi:hypothetical protein
MMMMLLLLPRGESRNQIPLHSPCIKRYSTAAGLLCSPPAHHFNDLRQLMLPYPKWFQRLPEIVETLSETDAEYLYRKDIQRLLGVQWRQALILLKQWTTEPVHNGKPGRIHREVLREIVEQLSQDQSAIQAVKDRKRVLDTISEARKRRAEKRLQLPATSQLLQSSIQSLPQGVVLQQGRLVIEFEHVGDFMDKLGHVLQAAMNEFDKFEQICGSDPKAKRVLIQI